MESDRPIGWWVKRLDELLEQVVERAVAADGLTRRHWQVLHHLATAPEALSGAAVADDLEPFTGVDAVLGDLAGRGWLRTTVDGRVALTASGRAAHERLMAAVGRMRRQVAEGLTPDEYAATVSALARMVANAERALSP